MSNEPGPGYGSMRKEMTQCQHCAISRLRKGVTLSKCAGCQIALYCNRECQKAAWPQHKQTCKLNQRVLSHSAGVDPLKPLRKFTSQHRLSFTQYGLYPFDLASHPQRYLHEVLLIMVKARPGVNRPELSYIALEAGLCPLSVFGDDHGDEIRQQMEDRNEHVVRHGMLGLIWVVLFDKVSAAMNWVPVGFGHDVLEHGWMRDPLWKETLLHHLNNGIIV